MILTGPHCSERKILMPSKPSREIRVLSSPINVRPAPLSTMNSGRGLLGAGILRIQSVTAPRLALALMGRRGRGGL